MKNCTWCSSELSRFRGNNYQSGDLCFSSPTDKHPEPWGTVGKWYSFKRVKFHCPPPFFSFLPSFSPLEVLFHKSVNTFFCWWGKKKEWETIKNMKSPSSQNIRHRKTTLSYDWIYQNWQVKVDCCVSIDWAIFQWKTIASWLSSHWTKSCYQTLAAKRPLLTGE